jgi:hypothetical protein
MAPFCYSGVMERRKYEGNKLVFDYRDLVGSPQKFKGKKLIKMKHGPITYTSPNGARFFRDHPFQWVEAEEADHLLSLPEGGYVYFVKASKEDVEDYYVY